MKMDVVLPLNQNTVKKLQKKMEKYGSLLNDIKRTMKIQAL